MKDIRLYLFLCKKVTIYISLGFNITDNGGIMRNWMWSAFVFIITFAIIFFFDLPMIIIYLIVIPALIFIFIQGSFAYSFRDSLAPDEIPPRGYDQRIKESEKRMSSLPHGFKLIDRFYLKAIPDSVTYAFIHESEPVICCIYNFGNKQAVDFVTIYNDGFTLTTNDTLDGGMAPRPEKNFVQIFPGQSYEKIYNHHMESHIFLIEQGLRPIYIHGSEFRHYFMKEYRAQGNYIKKIPFWTFILLFRTVTKYGKKYAIPLKRQVADGITRIFM